MRFRDFLAEISIFLLTGKSTLPGQDNPVSSLTVRLAQACTLYEKEYYKNLERVTAKQVDDFYKMIYLTFLKIPPSEFQQDLRLLDSKAKEILLRNIGTLLENCEECNLASYTIYL